MRRCRSCRSATLQRNHLDEMGNEGRCITKGRSSRSFLRYYTAGLRRSVAAGLAAGSVIRNVLPARAALPELQVAAHRFDRPLGDRQSETDAAARVRRLGAIEAFEDVRFRAVGTPLPVSVTSTTACVVVSESRSSIRPPSGVYLMALSTTFVNACRSRTGSPRQRGRSRVDDLDRLPFLFREHAELRRHVLGKLATGRSSRSTAWPARCRCATR